MLWKTWSPRTFFGRCIAVSMQCQDAATAARRRAHEAIRGPLGRQACVLLIVFVMLAGAGCASLAPKASPSHAAYLASSAGDVISTERALAAGAREANPLLGENPSTPKLIGVKVATWAGLRAFEEALEREFGRDLKWWEQAILWAVPAGLQTWATFRNMGVADRLESR